MKQGITNQFGIVGSEAAVMAAILSGVVAAVEKMHSRENIRKISRQHLYNIDDGAKSALRDDPLNRDASRTIKPVERIRYVRTGLQE